MCVHVCACVCMCVHVQACVCIARTAEAVAGRVIKNNLLCKLGIQIAKCTRHNKTTADSVQGTIGT